MENMSSQRILIFILLLMEQINAILVPRYIGCYKDSAERDLDGLVANFNSQLTLDICVNHCIGFKYIGLQSGRQCYCGDSYGRYGKASSSECDRDCQGESSQRCGGGFRNDIYELVEVGGSSVKIEVQTLIQTATQTETRIISDCLTPTTTLISSVASTQSSCTDQAVVSIVTETISNCQQPQSTKNAVFSSEESTQSACTEQAVSSVVSTVMETISNYQQPQGTNNAWLSSVASSSCAEQVTSLNISTVTETISNCQQPQSTNNAVFSSKGYTQLSSQASVESEHIAFSSYISTVTETVFDSQMCHFNDSPILVTNNEGKTHLISGVCRHVIVVTDEIVQASEAKSSIVQDLTISKENLTAVIIKKISAEDSRPSAQAVGYLGVACFIVPIVFILASDLPFLLQLRRHIVCSN